MCVFLICVCLSCNGILGDIYRVGHVFISSGIVLHEIDTSTRDFHNFNYLSSMLCSLFAVAATTCVFVFLVIIDTFPAKSFEFTAFSKPLRK